jgi:hypothetical protein
MSAIRPGQRLGNVGRRCYTPRRDFLRTSGLKDRLQYIRDKDSPVKERLPNMPVKCNLVGATTVDIIIFAPS